MLVLYSLKKGRLGSNRLLGFIACPPVYPSLLYTSRLYVLTIILSTFQFVLFELCYDKPFPFSLHDTPLFSSRGISG